MNVYMWTNGHNKQSPWIQCNYLRMVLRVKKRMKWTLFESVKQIKGNNLLYFCQYNYLIDINTRFTWLVMFNAKLGSEMGKASQRSTQYKELIARRGRDVVIIKWRVVQKRKCPCEITYGISDFLIIVEKTTK